MALSLDGTTGISATGNIISSAGIISATGNIYGGNIIGTLVVSTATFSGNVTGGNLLTGGIVSATGNITGCYILGNGSQLTGVDATQIINGTSNARVVSSGGNITVGIGGTANVAVFATTGAFVTGVTSVSGNITGGNLLTAGLISATGNIQGGNLRTAGLISATGAITGAAITGSSLTVTTGNITGGNLLISGAIVDSAQLDIQTSAANANIVLTPNGSGNVNISSNVMPTANATANIGSSTAYFNTVFGKATTAQYADLAELYSADAKYEPGTVLDFGGTNEVTISSVSSSTRVAGVVSTNPAHLMNSVLESENKVAVALTGRVPTSVVGTVRKGDMMVTAGNGYAQASAAPAMGTVIGKALENFDGVSGVIEVVVGRL